MAYVRMSEAQAKLLFGDERLERMKSGEPKGKRAPRPKRSKKELENLPENIVERQLLDFLKIRGWTCQRLHIGSFVPAGVIMRMLANGVPLTKEVLFRQMVRVGAKGDTDWRAERIVPGRRGLVESFYFEVKKEGAKPS